MRKDDKTLHFTINGVDQGEAATNVPAAIYGIVDLFANAAQVTIVDHSGRATHIITCIQRILSYIWSGTADRVSFFHI